MKLTAQHDVKAPVTFEGVQFPSCGNVTLDEAAIQQLHVCRARERKVLNKLKLAHALKKKVAYGDALSRFRQSKAILVCSRLDANKKRREDLREDLPSILAKDNLELWDKPSQEMVIVRPKQKSPEKYRYICEFAVENRTMHIASRKLVSLLLHPLVYQYDVGHGRLEYAGVHAAISDASKAICGGYEYAAHIDVEQFFASFIEGPLEDLLGPHWKVVGPYATGQHLNVVVGKHNHAIPPNTVAQRARRGVPQGSALSALLGSLAISKLHWNGPGVLFNWVDDFLVLGQSKAELDDAVAALIAAVAALPGGQFSPGLKSCGSILGSTAVFLGHRLQLEEGKLVISASSTDRFLGEIRCSNKRLNALAAKPLTPERQQKGFRILADAWTLSRSWAAAHKMCHDAAFWREMAKDELAPHLGWVGCTWNDLENASDKQKRWPFPYV